MNPILNNLNSKEKAEVENALIELLSHHPEDMLIVETLANLKSIPSIPVLQKLLGATSIPIERIKIGASLFQINRDNSLVNILINDFKNLDDPKDAYYTYKLIDAFYYLSKLQNKEVDKIIKGYINHKKYLVSYNAKRYLGLLHDEAT